jgi:hypothetical protein
LWGIEDFKNVKGSLDISNKKGINFKTNSDVIRADESKSV